MDLTGMQELAARQGPLFWGAAAAATLGASLLVAAVALQARRLRPSLRRLLPRRRRRRPAAAPAMPLARAVPGGYAPAGPAGSGAVPAPGAGYSAPVAGSGVSPDYSLALTRLRRAGDKLARLQTDSADSRLKVTGGGVDLVSRRGVG